MEPVPEHVSSDPEPDGKRTITDDGCGEQDASHAERVGSREFSP
jgi:hypothetical protein